MTTVSITGHRPENLGDPEWVKEELKKAFAELGVTHVIQGMAEGADLLAAGVAWQTDIPFTAVRPWAGHGDSASLMHEWALRNAAETVVLNPSVAFPGNKSYHIRNEWMIDNADSVIAIWNGFPKGGTAASVRYARKVGKPVFIINPETQSTIGYN